MNLNKAFVLGNLTRDPERRNLPSGQPVASFGVATNRFFTSQDGQKQQDVEFHNIVVFGKLAEIASQYLKKGSLVLIEGRLKTRSWQDNLGSRRSRTEIIAERLQLGPRTISSSIQGSSQESKLKDSGNENIPVIEEGSTLEKKTNKEKEDDPLQQEKEEEIDVKDIPF